MTTEIKGVLIAHDGHEYLLTDDRRYPDLLLRQADGTWKSIKRKRHGTAGAMSEEMLKNLGLPAQGHTQTNLRALAARAVSELVQKLFVGAWGG